MVYQISQVTDLPIIGVGGIFEAKHALEYILAGATAVQIRIAVRAFEGLPHRLSPLCTVHGVRCIDDSKSTTPQATRLAVEAFDDPSKVHLIAGGYDKGLDLSPIVELAPRLAGLYTIGATGRDLAAAVAGRAPTALCHTLEAAVEHATARGRRGEVLLLSPGCASWDQYDNYEQRGEAFCECVKKKGRRD
ncbi:MAG: hypothetical protein IH804_01490 [Planctomycetes bacterium]|nr:hypothetical protein [Planctomycetota bacterium]